MAEIVDAHRSSAATIVVTDSGAGRPPWAISFEPART
jgi:hypothetical protein